MFYFVKEGTISLWSSNLRDNICLDVIQKEIGFSIHELQLLHWDAPHVTIYVEVVDSVFSRLLLHGFK